MLLYITGSYPESQEGIADSAKILLDAMINLIGSDKVILLTTNVPIISKNIENTSTCKYEFVNDWKLLKKNVQVIYEILDKYPISAVHMEYPGDLYGKTFLPSFLPYILKKYSRRKGKDIAVNVRLHEFTQARLLRRIAIIPILKFADGIYVPSLNDRKTVSKYAKGKVLPTKIGANITVQSIAAKKTDKIVVSYFGSVYPGKGIERMLSVWKLIKDLDTENRFVFKIIGDLGTEEQNHFREYHKQVWQWIEKSGLKDIIEVTGFIPDKEVSREIQETNVATLNYEDGLTLRRGSFLAYLAHGIPIVTTMGDEEAKELFDNHPGISMTKTDEEIIESVFRYSKLDDSEIEKIKNDNIELSKQFEWNNIAETFLKDYGFL